MFSFYQFFFLIIAAVPLSLMSSSTEMLQIVACSDKESPHCRNIDAQKEYALHLAQTFVAKKLRKDSFYTLHYLVQSDVTNTVTHFKISAHLIKNKINYLELNEQVELKGNAREEVMQLIKESAYQDKLVKNVTRFDNSNNVLNYHASCGLVEGALKAEINPEKIIKNCKKYLIEQGIFEGEGRTYSLSFKPISSLDITINHTVNRWVPLLIQKFDGTWLILKPHHTGEITVTSFSFPPFINLPVSESGQVNWDSLEEKLLNGNYTYNNDSLTLISFLAEKMPTSNFVKLELILKQGADCQYCHNKRLTELAIKHQHKG
jgi:hypothetical protein